MRMKFELMEGYFGNDSIKYGKLVIIYL